MRTGIATTNINSLEVALTQQSRADTALVLGEIVNTRDKILPAWNAGLATLQHQMNECVAKSIFHTQQKLIIIINKNSCDQNGIDDELVVEERQPKKRVRNNEN